MFFRLYYFVHVNSRGMLFKCVGEMFVFTGPRDLSDHSWNLQSLIATNHPQQSPVMTSLEQLVQDWLDLDKVRIHLANREAVILHYMGSREKQGPRSRGYGNQETTRSSKVGSGIYLPDHPFIIKGEILFKGRESSLGPQVRFILDPSTCAVTDHECRP